MTKPLRGKRRKATFDALLAPRTKKPDPRASIFRAIADRLRAGESYNEVLNNYGLIDTNNKLSRGKYTRKTCGVEVTSGVDEGRPSSMKRRGAKSQCRM